jgi:beta-1,4-mannosyl-glycoprotein beta-1,4-N-acetylglucosaminyltransferase
MYDYVDYFIIVEASMTFQDTHKPLYVQEHWSRFERYHSKMIRHTLNTEGVNFQDTWHRETFSRNAMYDQVIPHLVGKQAAALGDVILVSDVDEIPRPSTLTALRNCVFPQKLSLHSAMYYYSFQWANREDWAFPQATFYNGNDTVLPHDLRKTADAHLYEAAWHCSYCFSTIEEMLSKIKSFSHSELNLDRFKDPQQMLRRVRNGIDMYEREGFDLDRIEDNCDVPEFLRANGEKYRYMFDRDPENANFRDI